MDYQKIVQEIIPAKLMEIEARENIRVIHCIESGTTGDKSIPRDLLKLSLYKNG